VGTKPSSLSYAEAAVLPLTTLTAWELLFDRLQVAQDDTSKSILVIGAAGGVGSILVQLAKKLTKYYCYCLTRSNYSLAEGTGSRYSY
jgi:NADPH:quinone reductase-like Zn-dependent oxidoreductase